jgi:hypothetical protein
MKFFATFAMLAMLATASVAADAKAPSTAPVQLTAATLVEASAPAPQLEAAASGEVCDELFLDCAEGCKQAQARPVCLRVCRDEYLACVADQ